MKKSQLYRLLLVWVVSVCGQGFAAEPAGSDVLVQAHAHNDYEHARPLLEALEQGFGSVEADIWLVNGQLLVAHNLEDVVPGRSLQALYLDPLRERIRRHGGRVYSNGPTCTLLVDVKSAAEPTTAALLKVLAGYTDVLTQFTATNTATNALTIILTGDRSAALLAAQPVRYAALDGRLTDLEKGVPASLMPLISDNWAHYFKWRGGGPMPEAERQQLRQWVARAHADNRRLRFWGAPDEAAVWRELQVAGVDVIGTDHLAALAAFLRAPAP